MKEFRDKVALVTGAGSGIGRSMALAFAKEGMKVIVTDINAETLAKVEKEISQTGVEVMSKKVDVSNREQMSSLADEAYEKFGNVNILCNNAGIGAGGMFAEINLEDWDWMLGVNLYGVIYGVHFFLRRMLESKEECHIVNTASMAGLLAGQSSTYNVAKFGVVALSECLNVQTQNTNVGVSVLCPDYVKTDIGDNVEPLSQQQKGIFQPSKEKQEFMKPFIENLRRQLEAGISPDVVAEMVLNSIREKRFYIITHPEGSVEFLDLRVNNIKNQAQDLKEAMAKMGISKEKKEDKTYTHQSPHFTLTYPGDWVEQVPTPLKQFAFNAVSPSFLPEVSVHINEAPPGGLKSSIKTFSMFLSGNLKIENEIVYEKQTSLKDGTQALEAEIEMKLPGDVNKYITLVLNTLKDGKMISISFSCAKIKYNDEMKKKLLEIAYSLSF